MTQARYFSSTAGKMTLQGAITGTSTSITVDTVTGLPATPFPVIIDPGLSTEEICDVTAIGGTTLTITRGVDGTSAQSHNNGAEVRHGFSGRDFNDPQAHMGASAGVHGITGSVVGTTDTQSLTHKDLTGTGNTFPSSLATTTQLNTHASTATGVHGVTGSIVGTTDTQSLTHKNLTDATNTFPSTLIATTGVQSMSDKTALASAAGNHALVIKGAASQSADILSIQDSTGYAICAMTPSGWVVDGGNTVTQCTGAGANLFGFVTKFVATGASQVVSILKAAASQTADLLQIQNSAGTVIAKITAAGAISTNSTVTASGTVTGGNLSTGGNLTVTGNGTINGNLTGMNNISVVPTSLGGKHTYWGSVSGTTDSLGFVTVAHGAGFTPSGAFFMNNNPNSSFAVMWGADSFTSTQVRFRIMNAGGASYLANTAITGVAFYVE